ncbi:MAG TPA: carboxypeptidase-like regulatory domain-containing protein [Bryobacteraceae bacterium]|nr:carboxypeptidase-like regulatory domain-containing protein [Bryobacteraceae bacterium]
MKRFFAGRLVPFSVFAIALLLIAAAALGQNTSTGTVTGVVSDQSGAAVGGADVKLTDLTTNIALKTSSNDAGRYTFANVAPGTYNVMITKSGFSSFQAGNQRVDVGTVLTINAPLEIGSTTTTVEVTSVAGAELQVTNATVGQTITGQSLVFLPNIGRDASSFAVLQPGVAPMGAVAGAMYDQNTFQLDGGNNSNDMDGSMMDYTGSYTANVPTAGVGSPSGTVPTPVESIEEFKVATSGQTADFNGSSGSQVQMVTKRGTNQIHGSAYEYYFATDVGAANSWDNNHTPSGNLSYTPLPITHSNRFGAALGGPVIPKKVLGGKWYAFVNYEGFRFPQSAIFTKAVPTASLRAGVVYINEGSAGYVPYNLTNAPVTINGTAIPVATCPAGSCDPRNLGFNSLVSQLWNKYMPLPNTNTGGDHYNTLNFQGVVGLPITSNNYTGRIDHDFNDKWRFMASYRDYKLVKLGTQQVDIGGALPGDTLGTPAARAVRPLQPSYWVAGMTTNINATTTNDFRFSYLRNFWQWGTSAAPPQLPGLGGALEVGGESSAALIPYNVNTQSVRQRFWDGQDKMIRDDVTKIKGNHVITFGGLYQRNFDYHLRNDNGQGIMNAAVYQITNGPGIAFSSQWRPAAVPSSQINNWNKYYSEILGIVSQPQDLFTRSGSQLTLQPPGSYMYDQSIIPSYNLYFTDSWHMKPSLTLTYGLSYTLEMPPYELNGKQVELTDTSGHPIDVTNYLNARQQAALQGQVYNPTLGWATVKNVVGTSNKYPYNPFYGGIAPHGALAWNPHYSDGILGKMLGNGKTVVRGGYSRIFSRLNGVGLVLVPLLGTGLGQAVSCIGASMTGECLGNGGVTQATAFRIGTDGMAAPLGPPPSQTLAQPYIPGVGGNLASGSGSVLDANFRPARTDNFNFSIQRELSSHSMLEVGYIGRIIRNEWQQIDLDAVPYMTTLNGQSFAQAYANVSWPVLATSSGTVNVAPQPFFESALGGANSAFCKGFASCTAAVANNSTMNSFIANQNVYQLWAALNAAPSWTLGRTMPSTPSAGIPQGQLSAVYFDTSKGFGNYNAAYFSFTLHDWHGLTARSNFTWGRALGTGNQSQATSSYSVLDPWHANASYGPQFFDYKFLYNLAVYWQTPWLRTQKGVVGHLLGGWIISPLFTAQSGALLGVNNYNAATESFGEMNPATGSTNGQTNQYLDGAVLAAKYTGSNSANYNLSVVNSVSGAGVNSNAANGGNDINMFKNPDQVYNEFRPCILGYDTSCGGGGNLRGMPTWNLDATVTKDVGIWKEGRVGAQLIFQFYNVLNHVQLTDPYLDISDPQDFGVLGTNNPNGGQANSPRTMSFGLRIHW